MLPHLGVAEVHGRRCYLSLLAVLAYGVHDQTFVGLLLFHVRDERTERARQVNRFAIVVIYRRGACAKLVDLPAVEWEDGIYLVVALREERTPGGVMRIDQIDRTLERRAQRMVIQIAVQFVSIEHPLAAHAIGLKILQCPITEVIEQGGHPMVMRRIDIPLYGGPIAVTGDDVRPHIHRLDRVATKRMMVLPVPVLELHIVDVVAVEVTDDRLNLANGYAAVG